MFRVVTYNIKSGYGMDGTQSIRRTAEILADLSPDIVCLQEVEQRLTDCNEADQPCFLGRYLGMEAIFQQNVRLKNGGYGNCVLTNIPIQRCRFHPLPGSGESRGLLEVTMPLYGQETTVFCTHLSTDKAIRHEQAERVREIVHMVTEPKLLCGDLNDVRSSQTLSALLDEAVLRDAAMEVDEGDIPTLSTGDPRRIDFVLADLRFMVKSYQVIESDASDHRPVVVDLEFA